MERIDQVEVADVCRGRLVGNIHGVPEGQIPDGESLEFRIAGFYAVSILVVKLRQAGGQLTASRAGAGYDDERLFRFDAVIGAIALIADDGLHVRRVALGKTMGVNPDPPPLQLVLEELGSGLIDRSG